eukprot:6560887-Lingulodinium_polyedra.AAC.1
MSVPLKTQVIPQQRVEAWKAAVTHSPFGPSSVAQGGRYFGVWPSATALGALQEGSRWGWVALGSVAAGIWRHPAT